MDETLIQGLIAAYRDALNDRDPQGVAETFVYPHVVWQSGRPLLFQNEADVVTNVEKVIHIFQKEGINHSSQDIKLLACEKRTGLCVIDWKMYDNAGRPKRRYHVSYHVLKTKAGWRIGMIEADEL